MFRRLAHLLLILAILPGVVLPGPIAICACAALSCVGCEGCCTPAATTAPCCGGHAASDETTHETSPKLASHKACVGCLQLAPEKHQTPRPQTQGHLLPDFAHETSVVEVIAAGLVLDATATMARPTSHAPPDELRSLPLLI
jgi:hypothetical protein